MTIQSNLDARRALDAIAELDTLDDSGDIATALRIALIDDDINLTRDMLPKHLHALADMIHTALARLDIDTLSTIRLDYSICPLHAIDYAICFDDDDPECAAIRRAFPSHDS